MHAIVHRGLLTLALAAGVASVAPPARAADIGVSPVTINLDRANSRATVNVVNNGLGAVVMQAEVVEWKRLPGPLDDDAATTDMIVNPAVFSLEPGQSQVVRVGLRKAAQADREGTYRVVLREVPTPPQPGETRVSGQVRVLMALRLPVYVAPVNVVRDPRMHAVEQADGSIVASIRNEGNVHIRVGRLRVRPGNADPAAPASSEQAVADVVFPGEMRQFKVAHAAIHPGLPLRLEVVTDQGPFEVPVTLARQ
jgi:fimbrial chaperone protein